MYPCVSNQKSQYTEVLMSNIRADDLLKGLLTGNVYERLSECRDSLIICRSSIPLLTSALVNILNDYNLKTLFVSSTRWRWTRPMKYDKWVACWFTPSITVSVMFVTFSARRTYTFALRTFETLWGHTVFLRIQCFNPETFLTQVSYELVSYNKSVMQHWIIVVSRGLW